MEWLAALTPWLFGLTLLFNCRAAWKLALDWRGMVTTVRHVRAAHARRAEWPAEEALEQDERAPVFLHLLAAYQEPEIARTLRGLLGARYPHAKVCFVVVTKESEERTPHPAMAESTGTLVRRFLGELPPYEAKRLTHLVMPGPGRKAEQLNWALRPEALAAVLADQVADPARVFVALSDADSVPDHDVYRWIAGEELAGHGALAYQGVTLSLGNWAALDTRSRICAIQQSSIFLRVSIARLITEVTRARVIELLVRRVPAAVGRWLRPALELFFRRSQICLGHNQFVRLDVMQAVGGFPTRGATEDSTLGYLLGARGVAIRALPLVELVDLPETKAKIVRQSARWYKGVLDDMPVLWREWRRAPTAYNLAQLCRHVGNKVVEWPVAARRVSGSWATSAGTSRTPTVATIRCCSWWPCSSRRRPSGSSIWVGASRPIARCGRSSRSRRARSRWDGARSASSSRGSSAARATGCWPPAPPGRSSGSSPAPAATSRSRPTASSAAEPDGRARRGTRFPSVDGRDVIAIGVPTAGSWPAGRHAPNPRVTA